MKKVVILILMFLVISNIFCCSSTDDNSTNPSEDQEQNNQNEVVSALVNGNRFSVPEENAIVDLSSVFSTNQLRFICVTDTDFTIDNEAVTITVFFADIEDLVEGVEWDSSELDFINNSIRGIYQAQDDDSGESVNSTTDNTSDAYLKITKLDLENSLVSGVFNFVAEDEVAGELKTYTVTNGVFTNVRYVQD